MSNTNTNTQLLQGLVSNECWYFSDATSSIIPIRLVRRYYAADCLCLGSTSRPQKDAIKHFPMHLHFQLPIKQFSRSPPHQCTFTSQPPPWQQMSCLILCLFQDFNNYTELWLPASFDETNWLCFLQGLILVVLDVTLQTLPNCLKKRRGKNLARFDGHYLGRQ